MSYNFTDEEMKAALKATEKDLRKKLMENEIKEIKSIEWARKFIVR